VQWGDIKMPAAPFYALHPCLLDSLSLRPAGPDPVVPYAEAWQ
jgi:hypothetical protein